MMTRTQSGRRGVQTRWECSAHRARRATWLIPARGTPGHRRVPVIRGTKADIAPADPWVCIQSNDR